jgi:3'(2'), 5'-bisphosphate nucleotidase
MISLHLAEHFPKDPIIGEEDTSELKANDPLRERVIKLVNEYHGKQSDFLEDR